MRLSSCHQVLLPTDAGALPPQPQRPPDDGVQVLHHRRGRPLSSLALRKPCTWAKRGTATRLSQPF